MAKPDLKKQFDKLETELLTYKYHYHILDAPIISNYDYDKKERRFFEIGSELGIDMDAYPNWEDFDYNHSKALNIIEGIERSLPSGS